METIELNKVYKYDCMKGMRKILRAGGRVNLTLTDIPYDCVNKAFESMKYCKALRQSRKGNADVLTFDLIQFLELVEQITTGSVVMFCGAEQLSTIKQFFINKGWTTRVIVWEKTNPAPLNGKHNYLYGIELAVFARRSGAVFNAFCKNTVFRYPCSKNTIHPTMKPLELWYELIKDLTNPGDIILDPCMGSFTTAVAAHKLGRRFAGFELDPDYFARGLKRLKDVQAQTTIFDL